ncbi:MAG TPA: aminodeoxychorismate/anthranilate synthase component II [Pirellulales bacterium]|jgi:anthranilate synthase/aminodeoxychorismate synthase-like glutamine amidotransferase|nr:aminodeoxychorismate/anthranilate synthase component II [Pirellulales bacterium]
MILLIDNYDSFVFNLARYFQRLGHDVRVVRNDQIDAAGVRKLRPAAVVLSPGPCAPEQAGSSIDIVRSLHGELPILGVCLGHQAIAAALGGRVIRAREPVHGRASRVFHSDQGVLAGLANPFLACRYHSLVVEEASLPEFLEVTGRTADGVVMAIEHRERPVVGVQFHPESILTQSGYTLLANFLHRAGLESLDPDALTPELESRPEPPLPVAARPVAF